jgi:hypothetical protein
MPPKAISLPEWITPSIADECYLEAKFRTEQQIADLQNGNLKATYSYGATQPLSKRSYEQRLADALIGAKAECLFSLLTKTEWLKPRQQYNRDDKSDASISYRNERIPCHIQGGRKTDTIIYRPWRLDNRPKELLFVVTNLPDGPDVLAGHRFCGYIKKLCATHPEWQRDLQSPRPYYAVPVDCFLGDFSEFC